MAAYRRGLRALASCAALVALAAGLASCGSRSGSDDPNPQVYGLYDRVPEGGGRYKVGAPYRIGGRWYHPREDATYDQTGVASWYGEYFHGRKTANGEWYDMNRMSAAHPTLPLPVYARVTNLENGRSLVVRINDRGPFKHDRIIDLSKGAATQLGMLEAGTAPVRVTFITNAPLEGDPPAGEMQALDRRGFWGSPFATASAGTTATAPSAASAPAPLAPAAFAPEPPALTAALDEVPLVTGSIASPRPAYAAPVETTSVAAAAMPQDVPQPAASFYVQAASFTDPARANALAGNLVHLGAIRVQPAEVSGETWYRVRLGPVGTRAEAESMVGQLAASGLPGGAIIKR